MDCETHHAEKAEAIPHKNKVKQNKTKQRGIPGSKCECRAFSPEVASLCTGPRALVQLHVKDVRI